MIIGPFWCEEEKSWIRFVTQDDGKLSAEVSKKDGKDNTGTLVWTPEKTKDFWFINYESGNQESFTEGLRLQDGILHRTDFTINKLRNAITVCTYNRLGQKIPVRGKINPFSQKALIKTTNITPYDQLPKQPLTDEELANITTQWDKWKTEDHRKKFNSETINVFFTNAQNEALYGELERELIEFSPQKYPSFTEYKAALESAISNPADPIHALIQKFAARTSFEEAPYLRTEKITNDRAEVYKQKQLFAYAVLTAERDVLLKEFKAEVTPIQTVPLKVLSAPPARPAPTGTNPPPVQPRPAPIDGEPFSIDDTELNALADPDLQRALLLSTSAARPNPAAIGPTSGSPDHPVTTTPPAEPRVADPLPATTNAQPVTAGSLPAGTNSASALPGTLSVGPALPSALSSTTALIQRAVTNGVNKYQSWYKQENDSAKLRGITGWFTWFRHGSEGQKRATELRDAVNKENICEFNAIALISDLLTKSSTRFHRHSLASFLLDELRVLAPWHGLSPDKQSNCYDQEQVVLHLNQSKPITCE